MKQSSPLDGFSKVAIALTAIVFAPVIGVFLLLIGIIIVGGVSHFMRH